jgi:hypothetical protein
MIHSDEEWEPLCATELPIPLTGDRVAAAHDNFLLIARPFLFLRSARPRSVSASFRARDENGKARPAAGNGGNVDAVAQNSERLAHDEEPDAQTVTSCGIKPGESLEDFRHLFARDSNARVVHIDPDTRTEVPATKKDPPSGLCVLDCIADQITQGGAEEQAVTQYRGVAGNHVDAYALAQRSLLVLSAGLPQDLMDAKRRELETSRTFSDAQRSQYLLQLVPKPIDRALAGSQTSQFGARSDSKPKEFVSALNDLEWLSEVVPGYGQQHPLEIRDFFRSRGACHPPTQR